MQNLSQWLSYCEKIHPQNIVLGLERVQQVAAAMQLRLDVPAVVVAGTNGKGSVCAMLEAIFLKAGYKTGVYTSPHLIDFQERCRIGGEIIAAEDLVPYMHAVEQARTSFTPAVQLTYFEFTTLAILALLAASSLDVAILEVGMGGRLDAVNIIDAACAIITSVDIDHIEFLGNNREQIGREKAGIARSGKPLIVCDPLPPQSIVDYAKTIGAELRLIGKDFNFSGDRQQWSWYGVSGRYYGLAYPALRGANQLLNAAGVLAALESLQQQLPVNAQAVRSGLAMVQLPGRFQIMPGQPVVVLDVAHNPHAAAALAKNLDAMGFYAQTYAVFGVMADKELEKMFQLLGPVIDNWYFIDLPTPRAMNKENILKIWRNQNRRHDATAQISPSLGAAILAIKEKVTPADRIVVFGSFYTASEFLQLKDRKFNLQS